MKVNSYKCDECGIQKGETNHWYAIESTPTNILVYQWIEEDGYGHYCSDACVIKAVQKWLSQQKELSQKGEQL